MRKLLSFLAFVIVLASCGSPSNGSQAEEQAATSEEAAEMKYTLTPFTPSPAFEDAALQSMNYSEGTFTFEIGGDTYQLGAQTPDAPQKMCANSDKGQHIHLIVDDQPYAAKYEPSFTYEVADGMHYLLAFLSRSYHESIKTDQAFLAQKVVVKDQSITDSKPVNSPMLFYSRPKGNYVGKAETEKVMLDYYLVGTAEEGYQVEADINGEKHLLNKWQPYYIEGLPIGKNTITLTLLDKEGKPVEAPLNPVSRTFELLEDPTENL